jgi:cell division protein FtsN
MPSRRRRGPAAAQERGSTLVAVRRGRSQARRNHGPGIPGWAWLVLGLVLGIGVILGAPRLLRSDGDDGFFRPRPNPDAQPAASAGGEDDVIVPDTTAPRAATAPARGATPEYDFYTLLPGEGEALTDAQLAETARAEARQAELAQADQADSARRQQEDEPQAQAAAPASTQVVSAPAVAARDDGARYLLQAGAFGASGDAEAVKARIALLGLSARVESAQVEGRTVYRVRMGPYGSAGELAEAKRKLADGGLPALAIRAN